MDKTFCASPDCVGECHRKMTKEMKEAAKKQTLPIGWAYFCGNGEDMNKDIDRAFNDGEI